MKTVASDEHLKLSGEIKALHSTLRNKTKKLGVKRAWQEHLQSKSQLQSYAKAMKELAVNHWAVNDAKQNATNTSKVKERNRITWTRNFCRDYFLSDATVTKLRQRELRILSELNIDCTEINQKMSAQCFPVDKIQLLDVGSCYNPFKPFDEFHVTAIDIAPAIDDVYECDFLNVELANDTEIMESSVGNSAVIKKLPVNKFHVVVFSLLLEYLPTSEQRLKCCEKAAELLQNEGILCIITPDSKHPGVNAKLMKTWRYALAQLGLGRIKIEKLEHITCMTYRKCLDPEISQRWARMHKEPYMEYKMEIPQDFTDAKDCEDGDDKNGTTIEEVKAKDLDDLVQSSSCDASNEANQSE